MDDTQPIPEAPRQPPKPDKAARAIWKKMDEAERLLRAAKDEADKYPSESSDTVQLRQRLADMIFKMQGLNYHAYDWMFYPNES